MMFRIHVVVIAILVGIVCCETTESGNQSDHSMDPAYYSCPFSMFDAGKPSTDENGAVMYCDTDGATCPSWYFCSAGYDDGRSVCCHILGV